MRPFQCIKQPSDTILWSLNGTVLFLKTRAPPHWRQPLLTCLTAAVYTEMPNHFWLNHYLQPLHRIPADLPNKSILFLIASVWEWEAEAAAECHPISLCVLLTSSILLCRAGINPLKRQQPLEHAMFPTRRVPARLFWRTRGNVAVNLAKLAETFV